jgi:hypothetical protein
VCRLPNSAAFVAVGFTQPRTPSNNHVPGTAGRSGLPANRRSEMDYEASNTAILLVSHNSTAALLTISLPPVLGGREGAPKLDSHSATTYL